MVTDDPNLKDESGTWEVVVDDSLIGSPFDRVLQVRYNPFKYTEDRYVIKIDGSVGIEGNLDALIDKFIEDGYDLSLMFHPTRNTMLEEYSAWVQTRQYPVENANYVLSFLAQAEGWNVKEWKGLCQLCYQIEVNNRLTTDLNRMTYAMLKYLGDRSSGIERVDQCIYSFVVQKYFGKAKILWVDQRMYQSQFFQWYPHHSDTPFAPMDVKKFIEPFWMNKRIHNQLRPQDL